MADEQKTELEAEVDRMMDARADEPEEPASAPELTDEADAEAEQTREAAPPVEADEQTVETDTFDDDRTDQAIKDISKNDSDEVLAAEDDKRAVGHGEPPKKGNVFKRWWRSKPWRYVTLIVILALITAALTWPTSRYWIFNQAGLRGQLTVTVLDNTNNLPLKGAVVSLDGQHLTSDKSGQVKFSAVELGPRRLTIKKPAFASLSRQLTVHWGRNDLGELGLKAVGIQYKLTLTDYLSGQPIAGAEVSAGQASALSDIHGLAVLTSMDASQPKLKATIKANGYHDKTVSISSGQQTSVQLVPTGHDYFISKASGDYDVFASNLDGSQRRLMLAGTGNENGNLQLASDDDGGLLALVSVRDDKRGVGGDRLQALTIINTATKQPLTLDHAKRIQLIGWLDGETLVYVAVHDCAGDSPLCYRLISYDYSSSARKELTHASSLSAVLTIGNKLYYATSSTYQQEGDQAQFVSLNSDGTNRQVLLKKDVYTVFRPSYDQLLLAAPGSWYNYRFGDATPSKIDAPSNPQLRHYVDGPNGQKAAWIDQRDGQPVLLIYDKNTQQNKVVASLAGLSYPVRWLSNDTLIFRVDSASETADYAFSLSGGEPKKITNVTDASGSDDLHY